MKSLSLSRPLVVMVIGLPGSGKSFFARQFSDMFAAPLVSADYVRHAFGDDSEFSAAEDALVSVLTNNQIDELLKTGKTFLVDGGMNSRAARQTIHRAAKQHEYGILTIWVQTDEPTSYARSNRRSPKRQTDELNTAMSQDAFERYQKQFTIPTRQENVVVVSGKHTFTTQARIVLKKLVAPRDVTTTGRQAIPREQPKPEQTHAAEPQRRNVPIN